MDQTTTPTPAVAVDPNARTFAILAHIGGLFTGWLAPLILWLIKKDEPGSQIAADAAKEALNFQITLFFVYMALTFTVVGLFLIWVPMIVSFVFSILAAVKASNGVDYKYPLTLRLIKYAGPGWRERGREASPRLRQACRTTSPDVTPWAARSGEHQRCPEPASAGRGHP